MIAGRLGLRGGQFIARCLSEAFTWQTPGTFGGRLFLGAMFGEHLRSGNWGQGSGENGMITYDYMIIICILDIYIYIITITCGISLDLDQSDSSFDFKRFFFLTRTHLQGDKQHIIIIIQDERATSPSPTRHGSCWEHAIICKSKSWFTWILHQFTITI